MENVREEKTEVLVSGMKEGTYLMLMHLSVLCIGIVGPIIFWAINKDKCKEVDIQGKIIFNWVISSAIYIFISSILTFIFIGFLFISIIMICCFAFPIIGGIRANNGVRWVYPLSLKFFKN